MLPEIILPVVAIAFILAYIDTSVGMGYGITIAPLLLLSGFPVLQVIPAVLLTNAIIGIVGGFFHHNFENVKFKLRTKDFNIASALTATGILGVIIAIILAINLPEIVLKIYIGLLILIIGLIVLFRHKRKHSFHWSKIYGLGMFAAFNKGMTGAGYGSILVGGQILSGVESKKAVGITTLTEGLVSVIGFLIFASVNHNILLSWPLIVSLLIGGIASTPLAAYTVSRVKQKKLKIIVGLVSMILGVIILTKLFL